jgi:hypothetical protein
VAVSGIDHLEGTVTELPRLESQNGNTRDLHQTERGSVHDPLVATSGDHHRNAALGQMVDGRPTLSGIDRCRRAARHPRTMLMSVTERVEDRCMLRQGDKQRTGGGIRLFRAARPHQGRQRARKPALGCHCQAPGHI